MGVGEVGINFEEKNVLKLAVFYLSLQLVFRLKKIITQKLRISNSSNSSFDFINLLFMNTNNNDTEHLSQPNSYRELLFDARWLNKKAAIIKRDNFCCAICGSTNHIVVHHKQYHYKRKEQRKCYPWEYDDKYLITLCENCHKRGHFKFKIPMKFID